MTKNQKTSEYIKKLCCMAMMIALSIAADFFIRVPVQFLTYEPSDVIEAIGGFIFGPIAGIAMALVVSLIEMITIGDTGIIGFIMNFIASAAFVGVSALVYYRKKTLTGAIIGLICGSLSMVIVMLIWNYVLTPIYTGMPREAVLDMFIPLLIPFNTLKVALNSALVLLLYKGTVTALRKSRLIPTRENNSHNYKKNTIILIYISAILVITLILILLIFAGII